MNESWGLRKKKEKCVWIRFTNFGQVTLIPEKTGYLQSIFIEEGKNNASQYCH